MFAIPSLPDLVTRARKAFRTNLPGSDSFIWPNNINPTAKVLGGLVHEVFGFADYVQKQKFALTADSENLDLHGEEFGLARTPAGPAQGPIDFVAPVGPLTILDGALVQRSDGIQYRVVSGGTLPGAGTLTVTAIATTDGATTSAISDTPLEILTGLSGDDTTTCNVNAAGILGGTDVEDDDSFRERILFRKRNPPHGGAPADYVLWAREVSGVTRVFVERRFAGVGTVRVFPLFDDLYPDGIAPGAVIANVQDHIDGVAPAGATVTVAAPVAVPINVTISGLVPNTTAVQQAVTLELRDAFRRLSRVAGIDRVIGGLDYLAYPTSFSRSWIWQAVANASGEQRHAITLPSGDITLAPGQIATLGTITFV
jgi:uncharacterized phage protein gp47/JayE